MLLVVDVGNTQTHIGCFQGAELRESWRCSTHRFATADDLALQISGLTALRGIDLGSFRGAIVSSVVPRLGPEYGGMSERYLGFDCLVVGPAIRIGMPILTENPHEVGADRIVNAVAAYDRFGGPCIVVDFGTAINYDAVSAGGEYLGGAIAPGIEISLEALATRAARLPRVELREPDAVIGRNTQQAIGAGIVYGFAGKVDGVVPRIAAELGPGTKVVATGGQAPAIAPFCTTIDEVDENLTLTGLRLIWERNQ